jgi:hypothetical protein
VTAAITLTTRQATWAERVGVSWASWADFTNATKDVHTRLDRRYRNVQAAGSELALALYAGGEDRWNDDAGPGRHLPDVMPDLEARWIRFRHWRLAIYPDDHLERRFVLLFGELPVFEPLGWIDGVTAWRIGEEYQRPPHGRYVAQRFLQPMGALI